ALCGEGARRWKCAAMRLNQSPDAGEGRLLTRRAEGAATLTARGTGVGHTSTYSDVFNERRERRKEHAGFQASDDRPARARPCVSEPELQDHSRAGRVPDLRPAEEGR